MAFNLAIILCCDFEDSKHTSLRSVLGHYPQARDFAAVSKFWKNTAVYTLFYGVIINCGSWLWLHKLMSQCHEETKLKGRAEGRSPGLPWRPQLQQPVQNPTGCLIWEVKLTKGKFKTLLDCCFPVFVVVLNFNVFFLPTKICFRVIFPGREDNGDFLSCMGPRMVFCLLCIRNK